MKPPADLDAHRARRTRRPTREELQRRAADIERAEAARLASVPDNDDDQEHGVDQFNGGPLW